MTILALLAGGGSTRMGRDKALLPLGSTSLLAHLAGVGHAAGLAVVVCGRSQPADWPLADVRFVPDAVAGEGPLRGLEAALALADDVVLAACDLPCLTPADLTWLLAQTPAEHGVATRIEDQLQPLFSRYLRSCLPLVGAELAAGRRSPLAVLRAGRFTQAQPPPAIAARLRDADTPADWQRLTGL